MSEEAKADCRVLMVGAGPVGLALASYLRRAGLAVRIVEKRSGPSLHSKAIGLQHRVSELLAILGVADRFAARAGSPTSVNIYEGHQRILELRFPTPEGISGHGAFRPRPLLLPQSETERLLADLLAELGTNIEWETELVGYRQDATGVDALLRTNQGTLEQARCGWLVSCEGAHSTVRKQSGLSFQGKSYSLAFLMADVVMRPEVSHLESHVWLHPDGSVALLPLPPEDTWRLFIEVSAETSSESADISMFQRVVWDRAPALARAVIEKTLWLSDFRINARMVDRMRDGRVFLAGDAAHIHSPTGGKESPPASTTRSTSPGSWRAGKRVRRTLCSTPMARSGCRTRLRCCARPTGRPPSYSLQPSWRYVRDYLVLPLLRIPAVQRRMFGKFSQLHVHYGESSLSQQRRARPPRGVALRAGDRAPDVAFLRAGTGTMITLFELLRELRPLLLIRSGAGEEDTLVRECEQLGLRAGAIAEVEAGDLRPWVLTDLHGDFARLYGAAKQFVWLIRPDGHVGLFLPGVDRAALGGYLRLLVAPSAVDETLSGAAT